MIDFRIMLPPARRAFVVSWAVAALIVLGSQMIALLTPPAAPGSRNVVLIGPAPVVFAALAVNLLILWRLDARFRGKFNRLGGYVVAGATGLAGSLLTIFATTIAVNLGIVHFSS